LQAQTRQGTEVGEVFTALTRLELKAAFGRSMGVHKRLPDLRTHFKSLRADARPKPYPGLCCHCFRRRCRNTLNHRLSKAGIGGFEHARREAPPASVRRSDHAS